MLRITSPTCLSTILQSLIDAADEDKARRGESSGNKINLLNLSALKKSTGTDYPTSESAKKGGNNSERGDGNIKTGVKVVRGSNYLTPETKKTFNYLQHVFT